MSKIPYTGNIHHPDMTVKADLTFWFYPDEGAFYFEGDKGKTTNIWKNARCSYAQIGISYFDNLKLKKIVFPFFFYILLLFVENVYFKITFHIKFVSSRNIDIFKPFMG